MNFSASTLSASKLLVFYKVKRGMCSLTENVTNEGTLEFCTCSILECIEARIASILLASEVLIGDWTTFLRNFSSRSRTIEFNQRWRESCLYSDSSTEVKLLTIVNVTYFGFLRAVVLSDLLWKAFSIDCWNCKHSPRLVRRCFLKPPRDRFS